ncbi:MAG TPA: ribulose-phosphate 3-epimerase [Candidatus Peribacterales bacterium]|nr:ribulose-phosphate 3-epimerase [Candidatus Peribacterales bacterium]
MFKLIITPSILSADFSRLQEEVDSVAPYADWLQVDVMDGHFVPNLSFGAPVMKAIKTTLPLDVHLMVSNPSDRIDEFVEAGATHITFHAEAVPVRSDQEQLIARIRGKGCTAGIAVNPETSLDAIQTMDIDLVLCMTVHPGFGGQGFIESVIAKIKDLHLQHPDVMIQVDGGITAETGKRCREAGANNLVAGSYIFKSKDRKKAIESLRK